ncbi:MAG: ribosome assembly RNA-binding protein YhbY [Gammaproteobacteria bacterium]|nr:ribosome assembly RNA-binding protein YhbY [Gammaproteobacteria bacterium]
MSITQKQRRHLKSLAHHLKPVVIVGQHGLNQGVLDELRSTFEAHELIKVRLNAEDRATRETMVEHICRETGSNLVQTIGHVGVFYRRDSDKPRIKLPE